MPHECQMEAHREPLVYGELWLARCICHEGTKYRVLRSDDFPYRCPVSGTGLEKPSE